MPVVVDEHVRGLHVAVHEAGAVVRVERGRDLRDDPRPPARRSAPARATRAEVVAFDEAHPMKATRRARRPRRRGSRSGARSRRRARLAQEALPDAGSRSARARSPSAPRHGRARARARGRRRPSLRARRRPRSGSRPPEARARVGRMALYISEAVKPRGTHDRCVRARLRAQRATVMRAASRARPRARPRPSGPGSAPSHWGADRRRSARCAAPPSGDAVAAAHAEVQRARRRRAWPPSTHGAPTAQPSRGPARRGPSSGR